jgi:hypothetical protein
MNSNGNDPQLAGNFGRKGEERTKRTNVVASSKP